MYEQYHYDPSSPFFKYSPWNYYRKRDDDDPEENRGCEFIFCVIIAAIIMWFFLAALTGCKQVEYVTVPEYHTEYVHTKDSVTHTDSVFRDRETTVMQLDSAAMAKYGIRLESAERAWLVRTKELERELQRIAEMSKDSVVVHDSVPYPVEVTKEVAAKLSWWQQTRIHLGGIVIWAAVIAASIWIYRKRSLLKF